MLRHWLWRLTATAILIAAAIPIRSLAAEPPANDPKTQPTESLIRKALEKRVDLKHPVTDCDRI